MTRSDPTCAEPCELPMEQHPEPRLGPLRFDASFESGNLAEARSFYSRVFEVDIGYRDVAQKMEQLRGS